MILCHYSYNKKNQRWLWYAWEPRFRRVLAHAFDRRNETTQKKLLALSAPYNFLFYCTDHFSVNTERVPAARHVATKKFTQGIERQNLTFRTRLKRLARKTICFSTSEELHDKVIGEFLSEEHYQRL